MRQITGVSMSIRRHYNNEIVTCCDTDSGWVLIEIEGKGANLSPGAAEEFARMLAKTAKRARVTATLAQKANEKKADKTQ